MSTHEDEIAKIKQAIDAIKQTIAAIEDAFIRDDLGKPDYHGHRKEHKDKKDDDDRAARIKDDAAKQVIAGAIGLIFTAIALFWGLR